MADNVPITPGSGATIATDDVGGVQFQKVKLDIGADGVSLPWDGSVSVSNFPATQAVSGTVAVSNFPLTQAVSGPLTDAELRATPIAVSGTIATGGLTDAQLRATPIPVDVGTLNIPPPVGAATEVTLDAILDKLPTASADMPNNSVVATPVRQAPQKYTDISFSQVGSGVLAPEVVQIGITGAGMTINQSAGNLVITTGTTANAEITLRSLATFNGGLTFKSVHTLSQRIANNNFFAELVDVIGDGLAYTIVNATTVDITKTSHGFTTQNVGQRIDICALSSVGIPMEAVIASIPNANTIRFTVAGWPASGSGTCSLTGWNKVELLYTGTTATNTSFNVRRRGWQNVSTVASGATTAVATMASINIDNGVASFADKTMVLNNALVNRAAWDANVPLPDTVLYLQLRARNGTVNPATTTTWTVSLLRVEDYIPSQVSLVGTRQQSLNNTLPVNIVGTVGVSGTVTSTVTAGTVNPVVPATPYFVNSAATTNGALVVAGTSGLQAFYATNTGATAAFVKLYNKATAPTVGTDVPEMIIPVPAVVGSVAGVATLPIGFSGFRFALGLGIAITGGVADNDTTAVAAGQVKVKLSRTI